MATHICNTCVYYSECQIRKKYEDNGEIVTKCESYRASW